MGLLLTKQQALDLLQQEPDIRVVEAYSACYQEEQRAEAEQAVNPFYSCINVDEIESGSLWNLPQPDKLPELFLRLGIPDNTTQQIVIFDTVKISCGENTSCSDVSARVWLALKMAGFGAVHLVVDANLNDSFKHTLRAVTSQKAAHRRATSVECLLQPDTSLIVSHDELTRLIKGGAKGYRLLDCRSEAEFNGDVTGYSYVQHAGTIPTAESVVNGEFQVDSTGAVATALKRLEERFNLMEIDRSDRLIWFCGTGWRASRMCALSHALGFNSSCVYDGGWYEWQLKGSPVAMEAEQSRSALFEI